MKILVLDVPGLHLGYLGCYGNDWVATPNIDRLASEGVVFDEHFFDIDQPKPMAWTGHHPLPWIEQVPSRNGPTLGRLLDGSDVAHAHVDAGGACVSEKSVQEMVAKVLESATAGHDLTWARFPSLTPPWDLAHDLLNSYCEDDEEPWPDPPHGNLENPDDLPRLQNTYAAVVTYIDAQLGALLDQLRQRPDDTLVCLTAACGLPLGEHGIIGQVRPWLHEEFVHLPLTVRMPRGEHAGLRVGALTQPVDLFPTFLEWLNIQAPPSHGQTLRPLIAGDVNEVRRHAMSGLCEGGVEWSLRSLQWAFLLPVAPCAGDPSRKAQLYVKPDDRWEVNNVRQHHLELAEEMERTLRDMADRSRPDYSSIFNAENAENMS